MKVYYKVDTTPMWVKHHIGTLYEVSYNKYNYIAILFIVMITIVNIINSMHIATLYCNTCNFISVVFITIYEHYTMILEKLAACIIICYHRNL